MRVGKARADAARAGERGLVLGGDGAGELVGREHREDAERDPRADPLHGLQQAEPDALGGLAKAVERDALGAHLGVDVEVDRLAGRRQRGERARRADHEIADAADVDHRVVLAAGCRAGRAAVRSPRGAGRGERRREARLARVVVGVAQGDRERIGGIAR